MARVIKITGKAKDVFQNISALAKVAGNVTLKELVWSKMKANLSNDPALSITIPSSLRKCVYCGKKLDCGKEGECYSDNPSAFTHPHLGGIYCRACYSKTHPFCSQCNTPLKNTWAYCPHCGANVK